MKDYFGGMAEWFKAAVLKTVVRETVPGVRIPLPPPSKHNIFVLMATNGESLSLNPKRQSVSNPRGVRLFLVHFVKMALPLETLRSKAT